MLEITLPILMILVYLGLLAWAIAYICSFGLSGFRSMASEFSGYSFGGVSALRLAYYFTFISIVLTPVHWWVDWRGDSAILGIVFLLLLATLILCLFVPRLSRGRFLPVAISVILAMNHSLLCKA